jgi:hypothetical protein
MLFFIIQLIWYILLYRKCECLDLRLLHFYCFFMLMSFFLFIHHLCPFCVLFLLPFLPFSVYFFNWPSFPPPPFFFTFVFFCFSALIVSSLAYPNVLVIKGLIVVVVVVSVNA